VSDRSDKDVDAAQAALEELQSGLSHARELVERTRLLLSGDTLYPGRLYVPADQFAAYRDSIDRVVAFTKGRRVSHILGAHVEMTTTPGKDLPQGAPVHAGEHALDLPYADLLELQAAVHAMGETAADPIQRKVAGLRVVNTLGELLHPAEIALVGAVQHPVVG